jgi:cyclopropane fatty-acyl-phospholipid synthase-like methyltransferase
MKQSESTSSNSAENASPHRLYERSVQCPEAEVDFISERFEWLRGRPARALREDFCGTAAVCCEWVGRHPDNRAVGVDLDPEVLRWAARRNVAALPAEAALRVTLVEADVMTGARAAIDVVTAMNFSYWLFRERAALRRYFEAVYRDLVDDGVLFLDAYGGYDAFREIVEERAVHDDDGSFTYIWEQARYNPIDGAMTCHIHFAFADGSRLERAFSYEWRLWTLPEIREILAEAGFRRTLVYWQGWDEGGEPNGVFEPAESADADAGWICYITAEK